MLSLFPLIFSKLEGVQQSSSDFIFPKRVIFNNNFSASLNVAHWLSQYKEITGICT